MPQAFLTLLAALDADQTALSAALCNVERARDAYTGVVCVLPRLPTAAAALADLQGDDALACLRSVVRCFEQIDTSTWPAGDAAHFATWWGNHSADWQRRLGSQIDAMIDAGRWRDLAERMTDIELFCAKSPHPQADKLQSLVGWRPDAERLARLEALHALSVDLGAGPGSLLAALACLEGPASAVVLSDGTAECILEPAMAHPSLRAFIEASDRRAEKLSFAPRRIVLRGKTVSLVPHPDASALPHFLRMVDTLLDGLTVETARSEAWPTRLRQALRSVTGGGAKTPRPRLLFALLEGRPLDDRSVEDAVVVSQGLGAADADAL
ncbi:MAG TPA: hypothetical protein VFH51_12150, partial [Myxococcota bacterium]|nr:hypothetical protein [Myxococcota bacterium]